jgi:hypothetical protein
MIKASSRTSLPDKAKNFVHCFTGVVLVFSVLHSTTSFHVSGYQQQQLSRTSLIKLFQQPNLRYNEKSTSSILEQKETYTEQKNRQKLTVNRRSVVAKTLTFSTVGTLLFDQTRIGIANALDEIGTGSGGKGIIRSKGCYQGSGDGCVEVSEDNPLIQQLQQKSIQNRERNEREALYAYYMKNYPDFFNSIGQVMIKKSSDGTFLLVSPQEAERMKALNQLSYEIPKTLGGTIVDYTQKPILILKE